MRSLLVFAGMVLGTVLMLKALDWLPAAFSRDEVRRYRSIEDARSALKIGNIPMPSYFPQYLSWPPDEILGRRRPYGLVLMHFDNQQRKEIALAIRQAEVRDPSPVSFPFLPL